MGEEIRMVYEESYADGDRNRVEICNSTTSGRLPEIAEAVVDPLLTAAGFHQRTIARFYREGYEAYRHLLEE